MSRGVTTAAGTIAALALALCELACGGSSSSGAGPLTGAAGKTGIGSAGSSGAAGFQGGSGGISPTGSGGRTATGAGNIVGSGEAGVSGAAGFSGGAAGATGTTANCISGATMPPAAALITDFSDAVPDPNSPGQFKFGGGTATRVQGGTSEFADTTETKPTLAITSGALSVSASSKGSYTGVVLYMNGPACIDGSGYTGVQFDLNGSLGTCVLSFGFAFADDLSPASDSQRGICAATNCYGPSVVVASTGTGTVKEPYTAVSGGSPDMGVDRQKLTGVQWQLQSPAAGTTCSANFTLDNISFY